MPNKIELNKCISLMSVFNYKIIINGLYGHISYTYYDHGVSGNLFDPRKKYSLLFLALENFLFSLVDIHPQFDATVHKSIPRARS